MIALYLAGASPRWQTGPDSALYLMLAENLAEGKGYTLFGEPHAFVPPGFPLFLAALMRISPAMYWLNACGALLALCAIGAGLLLLRRVSGGQKAAAAGLSFALSYAFYSIAQCQCSDVLFTLLAFVGLLACLRGLEGRRGWFWLGAAALWACCWVRIVGFGLAASAALALWVQPRKVPRSVILFHSLLLLAGLAATAFFFYHWHSQVVVQTSVPQETYTAAIHRWGLLDRSPLDWLAHPLHNTYQSGSALARALSGQDVHPAVAWSLFAAPLLVGMGVSWLRGARLCVVVALGYLGSMLLLRPMIARYLLPVLPLFYFYLIEGVVWLVRWRASWHPWASPTALGLLLALMAMNLAKDCKAVYRAHDPRWPPKQHHYYEVATLLRDQAAPGERFVGGGEAANILARISGVPYQDLVSLFGMERPDPPRLFRALDQTNVRFVLVWPKQMLWPYEQVLAEAIVGRRDFALVLENELISVYRRRAGAGVVATVPNISTADRCTGTPHPTAVDNGPAYPRAGWPVHRP